MSWGIGCRRTGLGAMGRSPDSLVKGEDGKPVTFETEEEAQTEARRLREGASLAVHYWAEEIGK